MRIEPKMFWELLGSEIKSDEAWRNYIKENPEWTKYIFKDVCPSIGRKLGYDEPRGRSTGFMTLDFSLYKNNPSVAPGFDWQMDLAFEHENGSEIWREELCKLSHIACGLKVLMTFHNYKSKPEGPRSILEEALEVIARHPYKTCPNRWLFIFGPTTQDLDHDFEVYESEDGITLTPINSAIILNPCR